MTTLTIKLPGRAYPIYIGHGALGSAAPAALAKYARGGAHGAAVCVVSDETVWALHSAALEHALGAAGVPWRCSIVPPGEASKSIDALSRLYGDFAAYGLKRDGAVVAFGGGVVGDLAGFAAATYMRGVDFIQIPTTLLAQVDSSVGGKVAINLPAGKNLAGSFHQPTAVIADTALLATLPKREMDAGMAEAAKCAAIGCEGLEEALAGWAGELGAELQAPHAGGGDGGLERIIRLCCEFKAGYVERDERDAGERMMLNFGHTFGHAIEKAFGFEGYNHGEAVAVGMALAAQAGDALGVTPPSVRGRLMALLGCLGLDTNLRCGVGDILPHMAGDKKNAGSDITLVLLEGFGKPTARRVSMDELRSAFALGEAPQPQRGLGEAPISRSMGEAPIAQNPDEAPLQSQHISASQAQRSLGEAPQPPQPPHSRDGASEGLLVIDRFPSGAVRIPPSKSAAHRALICAALARGVSAIGNVPCNDDIKATIRCLEALGAQITLESPGSGAMARTYANATIRGIGLAPGLGLGFGLGPRLGSPTAAPARLPTSEPALELDCGESGTTLRLLIPIAALLPHPVTFTGQGRLMSRPLSPLLDSLRARGARADLSGGRLTVQGPLTPGVFKLPGDVSSQFISGLLLAMPLMRTGSAIELTSRLESAPYVDMTLEAMRNFGAVANADSQGRFLARGCQLYKPQSHAIEADYSAAAFFLAAGALGRDCECLGLSPVSTQGDRAMLDILGRCGAAILTGEEGGLAARAPRSGRLSHLDVDVSDTPDLVPPLAAALCFCDGTSRILNAGRLRHKESDRLASVASELNALGARVAIDGDGLLIEGMESLAGGHANSWGDHRIAMMAAVAATRCRSPVGLLNSGCVAKSYPAFWDDFCRAGDDAPYATEMAGGCGTPAGQCKDGANGTPYATEMAGGHGTPAGQRTDGANGTPTAPGTEGVVG